MKQNKADYVFLGLSVTGFVALAASFMLMPLEGMGIIPGILFWGGFLVGVIFQIVLGARRNALFAKYSVKRETMQKVRNGLLSFWSNPAANVADSFLITSVAATVVVFILTKGIGYICYVCLSTLVLSFSMHCILNGRIFVFVKNQTKVRQVLEQKKANSMKKGEGKK